jgi:hypothetical protein
VGGWAKPNMKRKKERRQRRSMGGDAEIEERFISFVFWFVASGGRSDCRISMEMVKDQIAEKASTMSDKMVLINFFYRCNL